MMQRVTGRLLAYDEALLAYVRRQARPRLTCIMRAVTHLGDTASWIAVGLAMASTGAAGFRRALLLGLGAGLATMLAQLGKRFIRRPRPSNGIRGFTALVENPDAFSFPSGHTAAACGVAVALAGEATAVGIGAGALACSIAVSRVYLGAHYPLDVMVGAILGFAGGAVARLVVP